MAQQIDIVANLLMKVDGAEAGVNKLKNSLSKLKMPEGLENSFKKSFSNLDGLFAKYKAQLKDGFNTKSDVSAFTKTGKQIEAEYDRISASITKLTGKEISFKVDLTAIRNAETQLDKLISQKEKLIENTKSGLGLNKILEAMQASDVGRRGTKLFDASNILKTSLGRGDLTKAKEDVEGLITELNRMSEARKKALELRADNSLNNIIETLRNSINNADSSLDELNKDIKITSDNITSIRADQFEKVNREVESMAGDVDKATSGFKQLNGTAQETAQSMYSMANELEQLKTSTQYFFGLRNMINLFKRGIDDAVQSVKELDKAMTDTAVVTDYNISDLWGMLPEYTKIANELGATTQGAYETMTLYFQQGLDAQAAFEIGAETMKMARIAGLDYADATDMMTAALRGFNMELNDISAQRINDVYSKLAAVTASDTEELGTAMQRTASIAHSAGMSFEGTTAFLAQAIETTREPAENLGTAMKTIIARFQELKKNPLEITEVDGEEVDYNKIDAALKTIGVDLKDTNGQFRDLDKVFLDISQRWDSLSQTQQRYIATTAAGSRQQSRFIAMMSNYSRTVELMDAANNSAGASEEQFGKTMDSLEAKLNKLHNAWQQFTMGIANNGMIKGAVDGITSLLTGVNKLIDTFSLGIAPVKSLLSLLMAFTGLKAAGRIANSMIGGLGGLLDPQSSFGKGFKSGFVKNTDSNAQAQAISNPIVNAIHQLQAALTGKAVVGDKTANAAANYENFKKANSDLRSFFSGEGRTSFRVADAYGKIGGLDDRQQASILGQLPGLTLSLKKNGIEFDTKDLSKGSAKLIDSFKDEINQGLKDNTVTPQNAMQIFGTPAGFKGAMEARGPEYAKAAQEAFGDAFGKQFSFKELFDQSKQELLSSEDYNFLELDEIDKIATTQAQQAYDKQAAALENFNNRAKVTQSTGAEIANSFGKVGSYAMIAGQGVAQLGMQLSNAGFETAGAAVTNLGYKISSLGQIASSVGSIVGKITDLGNGSLFGGIKAGALAHPYIAAAALAVTAISTIIAIAKVREKKAKEAAEKVKQTYEDTVNGATEKISKLNSAKDTFNELAKGVDKFGNNINLTQEDYEQYLQTSQEIAQIAPELIRGYDAQGRAIIATGGAIDELIAKQEELKESARKNFVSNSSIDDLIGGFQVSDAFKKYGSKKLLGEDYGAFQTQLGGIRKALTKAGIDNFNEISEQLFGKEINLLKPSDEDIRLLAAHYNDIYRLIESQNSELSDKQKEGLQDAFSSLGEGWKAMLDELQPLSQAIGQYLSSEGLDTIGLNIGEEFTESFNKGLESLTMTAALEGWNASKIKSEAKGYAEGFKAMTAEGSEYAKIMAQVTTEQEKYNDSIGNPNAIENYKNAVENYASQLEQLANKYDDGTTKGQLFANALRETANSIRNYATESVVNLGKALDTLSDDFESARDAEDRFKKATEKGDYYTAAEGYQNIAKTVLDDKNSAGNGSLTAWAGAEEILGTKFVDSHTWDQIEARIKKIAPMFDDGIEGVQKFGDFLVEAAGESGKELKGLGEVIDGQFHFNFDLEENEIQAFADKLGIAKDALIALIDKSRQFVPWTTADPTQVRQALEQGTTSMTGISTKGENLLYTSESQFRTEAKQHGIRGDDYKKTKTAVEKEGVRFLTVENLTAKNGDGLYADRVLENIGLTGADKTLDNAVAAFSKMGFSLEDTQRILTADGIKLADGTVTNEQVAQAYNEQAYALENPTVSGIANDTSVIASAATAMLASMGILTNDAKEQIKESTSEETKQGYINSLNKDFTDSSSRDAARTAVEQKIADYEATMHLLEQGGLTDSTEYKALEAAVNDLNTALDEESTKWDEATQQAQSYTKNLGANSTEQQWLDNNALDIAKIWQNTDMSSAIAQLKQLEEEGNLSSETIAKLNKEFFDTHQIDLSKVSDEELPHLISELGLTQDEVRQIRGEVAKPFTFEILGKQELINYIDKIDELTLHDKEIILNSELTGEEKVTGLIDNINEEFAGGDEVKKRIIIEAAADFSNGNVEEARQNLTNTFGGKDAETIEKKLSVIFSGSIANPGEVEKSLKEQTKSLVDSSTSGEEYEQIVKVRQKVNVIKESNTPQGGNINYTTKVDEAGINSARQNAEKGATMPVDANTDKAKEKIADLQKPKSTTITVNAKQGTGWTQHMTIETDARGRNYSIPAHQSLSFGSAAGGMNVPKPKKSSKKDITALVGEEGFEVGYIPSERRSVIFGANGPEMTSFPSDTVIYPHDKSKEILRRGKRGIPTFDSFKTGTSDGIPTSNTGGSSSKSKKKTKKKKSKKKSKSSGSSTKNINNFSIEEVVRFNIDKKLTTLTNEIEDRTKAIEKTLAKIGVRYDDINKTAQEQVKALQQAKEYQQQLYNSNKAQLKDYLGRKEIVSYTTSGGKSKEMTIAVKDYLNSDGSINKNAIAKLDTRAKQEAVYKAISSGAKSWVDGMNNAQKAMNDYDEKIAELSKQISEAFYQWENELTEVYDLTQRIANETSLTDRFASQVQLELSKLNAGFGDTSESISTIRQVLNRNNGTIKEQIENQQQMINARRREMEVALSVSDEFAKLGKFQTLSDDDVAKSASVAWMEDKVAGIIEGQKYVKNLRQGLDGTLQYEIDWEGFEKQNEVSPYTKDTYEAIKQYLDDLNESVTEYNDAIKEQTDFIRETYESLREYQETVGDFEETLISGVEELNKTETENAKKLSSAITNSLKNLLDEVKSKLDERRKQEDNRKTESDISKKQQQLAALRANTAGGNQVQIAQLEKEIAEAQQSYQRTLEDQLLEKLQQQGDKAAEQRERLIALMEGQLNIAESNNKELVDLWLKNPEDFKDEIKEAWMAANGYDDKGEVGKYLLEQSFESAFAELVTAVEQSGFSDGIAGIEANTNTLIQLLTELNQGLIGRADSDKYAQSSNAQIDVTGRNTQGQVENVSNTPDLTTAHKQGILASSMKRFGFSAKDLTDNGYTGKEVKKGGYTAQELKDSGVDALTAASAGFGHEELKNVGYGFDTNEALVGYKARLDDLSEIGKLTKEDFADVQAWANAAKLSARTYMQDLADIDSPKNITWAQVIKAAKENDFSPYRIALSFSSKNFQTGYDAVYGKGAYTKNLAYAKKYPKKYTPYAYASGGLAKQTGPAWLDGTPSKPELVLNAKDTANFIALKDVLSRIIGSTNAINNTYGNATYEININVDHLNNDYDVDKVAQRVKKIIVNDSSYRNVTQVRKFR